MSLSGARWKSEKRGRGSFPFLPFPFLSFYERKTFYFFVHFCALPSDGVDRVERVKKGSEEEHESESSQRERDGEEEGGA
ncbi:hypothetical protein IE53DRAFT_384497 [Violaceomyces palustris]|uniref:Uncharacterized protein n=1 Tax=Violaceomyces palustris TaxID=1673888 RepID=A0ACD0P4P1_9BASI|nr:hypothetical protein IE53DRAFT_384497 [Violaceomyces palustris]